MGYINGYHTFAGPRQGRLARSALTTTLPHDRLHPTSAAAPAPLPTLPPPLAHRANPPRPQRISPRASHPLPRPRPAARHARKTAAHCPPPTSRSRVLPPPSHSPRPPRPLLARTALVRESHLCRAHSPRSPRLLSARPAYAVTFTARPMGINLTHPTGPVRTPCIGPGCWWRIRAACRRRSRRRPRQAAGFQDHGIFRVALATFTIPDLVILPTPALSAWHQWQPCPVMFTGADRDRHHQRGQPEAGPGPVRTSHRHRPVRQNGTNRLQSGRGIYEVDTSCSCYCASGRFRGRPDGWSETSWVDSRTS